MSAARFSLQLDAAVAQAFPDMRLAAVACVLPSPEGMHAVAGEQVAAAIEEVPERWPTVADLVGDPRIAAWRDAMRACGLSASDVRSSVEQLARRAHRGSFPSVSPVVDLYCAVSARRVAPLGGYDAALLPSPEIELRFGDPARDEFEPLGGSPDDFPASPRVPVYASGSTVICWAFNHRDSATTALRAGTTQAIFVAEAVAAVQHGSLLDAVGELRDALGAAGAIVSEPVTVGASAPAAEISLA